MSKTNPQDHDLTQSQEALRGRILVALTTAQRGRRPLLLTGEIGVGKSVLARRVAGEHVVYHNLARDRLATLLADRSLADVTPEALVRHLGRLVADTGRAAIVDGLDPLLSMWAVESPGVLPNLFLALARVTLDYPLLAVVRTSQHVPYQALCAHNWFPLERSLRLELTLADKEFVARNWSLDPMRARVSANLYELLATRLEG